MRNQLVAIKINKQCQQSHKCLQVERPFSLFLGKWEGCRIVKCLPKKKENILNVGIINIFFTDREV